MKRYSVKFIALLLTVIMLMSMTSCSLIKKLFTVRDTGRQEQDDDDDDDDDGDETEETSEPTDDTTVQTQPQTTDDSLTYPDHVASLSEVHPARTPGNVSGTEAAKVLKEVEDEMVKAGVDNYADMVILFEHPENYGLDINEVTWGSVTGDKSESFKFYTEMLDKLLTIDPSSLSKDDRIAYDKMLWDVEESVYSSKFTAYSYYEGKLNPLTGPQCEILFILDLIPVTNKKEAENYILLVKDLDRYFDDICKFEEDRVAYGFASGSDIYEQIAVSFDNLVKTKDTCFLYDDFKKKLDNIAGLSDADKADLIKQNDDAMKNVAFPEFEECAERMRKLKDKAGKGTGLTEFKGADDYFASTCRKLTNSGKTVIELRKDLDVTIDSVVTNLVNIVRSSTFNNNKYTSHDYTKGDLDANLAFLKEKVSKDFPLLPEHSYQQMYVPKDLEENFSPAAYLAYHLENYDSNQIIVNNGSKKEDFGVTCSHEGYPGHMFQSVYTRSHTNHPYLYLFDSIGYAEGWATYSETYAMKYYDDDDGVRTVVKIFDELNILLMARCDIGIHSQGWSIQDCADYMNKAYVNRINPLYKFGTKDIQEMYDLLVSDPGYAVKYGCGFVNTGLVMQDAHDQFPGKTDLEIHTAYLNAMPGTFEQIKKNMFEELQK